MNIAKKLVDALKSKKQPSAYDTPAVVNRIEGQTAWVRIAGGIDETPVQKTIDAKAGDAVNVRISGGKAWITGNGTAPPTDDQVAIGVSRNLKTVAKKMDGRITDGEKEIKKTKEIAEAVSKIAGDTNQHFWHAESGTDTGTHITEIPQEEFIEDPENGGGNLLARSNGIAVRDGLTELAAFSSEGVRIGVSGGNNSSLTEDGFSIQKGSTKYFDLGAIYENDEEEIVVARLFVTQQYTDDTIRITCTEDLGLYDLPVETAATPIWLNGVQLGAQEPGWYSWDIAQNSIVIRLDRIIPYNDRWWESGDPYLVDGDVLQVKITTRAKTIKGFNFGLDNEARSFATFMFGIGLISNKTYQQIMGLYNVPVEEAAFIVGNGWNENNRSNAGIIDWDGNIRIKGDLFVGCNNYSNLGMRVGTPEEKTYSAFTYENGFTYYATAGAESPTASRFGRVVTLSGAFKTSAAQSTTGNVQIGKVPSGYEPLHEVRRLQQGSQMNHFLLIIKTNGIMSIERYTDGSAAAAIPANSWLNIGCTFISKS